MLCLINYFRTAFVEVEPNTLLNYNSDVVDSIGVVVNDTQLIQSPDNYQYGLVDGKDYQSVNDTQNTRIQSIETINTEQNTSISIIQSVNTTQNTRFDVNDGIIQ
mgnify:CR=1 FL=1